MAEIMTAVRAPAPQDRTTQPQRSILVAGAVWSLWVLLSAIYLRPVLSTTVVADDLINPFAQFGMSGPALSDNLEFARAGVERSGHFNYLGQYVGAVYNLLWLRVSSSTGVPLLLLYAATKLVVLLLTALAVSAYVRAVVKGVGSAASAWQVRVVVSALLFGTLQLHVVWSNDPVASYPMSGFASAAFGFLVLAFALRGLDGWRPWLVGLLGTLSVLYYEINVAAVVAVGVVLLWWALGASEWSGRVRRLLAASPAVLVPFVVTLLAQLRAAPNADSYGGTSLSLGEQFLTTTAIGLAGALPASAWSLSYDFLGGPPLLLTTPLIVLGVLAVVLVLLARRWPIRQQPVRMGRGWLLVLAPVVYGVTATVIQAATAKVQDEITEVGMVYNFYAVSASAVAAVLALAVLLVPRRWVRPAWVATPLLVTAALFVLVQTLVTADLAQRFNTTIMPQSRALLQTYSEQAPEEERCAALEDWTALGLPDYYEQDMVAGLQSAYRAYRDEPFCTGFVRE